MVVKEKIVNTNSSEGSIKKESNNGIANPNKVNPNDCINWANFNKLKLRPVKLPLLIASKILTSGLKPKYT